FSLFCYLIFLFCTVFFFFIFAFYFSFNDTATSEIYTLSLHDALPIFLEVRGIDVAAAQRARQIAQDALVERGDRGGVADAAAVRDRKSTRLNSSHSQISYAVFCLKKKKHIDNNHLPTQNRLRVSIYME